MSIKILDTNCAINLLERLKTFDCVPFLSQYDTVLTTIILDELNNGRPFRHVPFEIHELTYEEKELYDDTKTYITELGPGERSAIVYALFQSNIHSCEDSDKIILFSDDKEAKHIFSHVILKSPELKRQFPNMDKIIWSRSINLIDRMWNSHLIDNESAEGILRDLRPILGPKLDFLKMKNRGRSTSVCSPRHTLWPQFYP